MFTSVFGPLACLDVPIGLVAASAHHWKTMLSSGFVGKLGSAIFQLAEIFPTKKPKFGAKRRKKNKHHL